MRDENARNMVKIIRDDGIFSKALTTFSGLEGDTPLSNLRFDKEELSESTKIPQVDLDEMLRQWPSGAVEPTINLLMEYYSRGPVNAK